MNFLMLRGQVPRDRSPQEIVFEMLESVDDMWTHLFYNMLSSSDQGELWYWGGEREQQFKSNFTERWVPDFKTYETDFIPDVIFCRGGFPEYHAVLKRYPKAFKIYYGAGARHLPQPGFTDYDLILHDSKEQLAECRIKFPDINSTLFIKPAYDGMFHPKMSDKIYDVVFPANGAQNFKGHKLVYSTVPDDITLLNLGNNPHNFIYPKNVTSYRVLRPQMASELCKGRVGIVASEGTIDSCPRVIPEMLACNIPIVVLSRVKFWKEKYIISGVTGEVVRDIDELWETVKYILDNYDLYAPRMYYKDELSLEKAARYIVKFITKRVL